MKSFLFLFFILIFLGLGCETTTTTSPDGCDPQCEEWQECRDNVCVTKDNFCESDKECTDSKPTCKDHKCILEAVKCGGVFCKSDEQCVNEICVPANSCGEQVCDPTTFLPSCRENVLLELCVVDNNGCGIEVREKDCGSNECFISPLKIGSCKPIECDDECSNEGEASCTEDKKAIQTCARGVDGCLDLIETICDDNKSCEIESNSNQPLCRATGECEDSCVENESKCNDDNSATQICTMQENSCLGWNTINCIEGLICKVNDSMAQCVVDNGSCSDNCIDSLTKCSEDKSAVQTCTRVDTGCLDWVDTACGDNEVCEFQLGSDGAQCVDNSTCSDNCVENLSKCNDDKSAVQTCTRVDTGCLDWVDTICGADEVCELQLGADGAECVDNNSCNDNCVENVTKCNDNNSAIQTCTRVDTGCLDWVDSACGADEVCELQIGGAECVVENACNDNCVANSTRCNGSTVVQSCVRGDDGCLDWSDTTCSNSTTCTTEGGVSYCKPSF